MSKRGVKQAKAALKTFQQAVTDTPDVTASFKAGLTAFGKYSNKIELSDTKQCNGSLDIDSAVTAKYPNDNRWDYALSYKSKVYFVEVHSANTGEVSTVLNKLRWLKDWLNTQAPEIDKLKVVDVTPYYWIQSGKFNILPNSPQFRRCVQEKLKPIPKLSLN